eukprot:11219542-Lingulodinium_polyedra.AAC.1
MSDPPRGRSWLLGRTAFAMGPGTQQFLRSAAENSSTGTQGPNTSTICFVWPPRKCPPVLAGANAKPRPTRLAWM